MRMSFGRYMPFKSPIHNMDSRLKIFSLLIMIVAVFFPIGFTGYCLLGGIVIITYILSRLPLRMLFKLTSPIVVIFLILVIINIIMYHPSSDAVFSNGGAGYDDPSINSNAVGYFYNWKIFTFSELAGFNALFMALRIFIMITITTIITGTTQPLELSIAIEDLLWPLKLIGIPVQILAMVISIALRMIPTLIDEAGRIIKAQSSRGIDMKNGKFKDKIKGMTSLIIPLLVSAFQRADDLANAMDSRGYDPIAKRTRYRQVKFRMLDVVFFVVFLTIAACLIAYSYVWPTNQPFMHIPHIDILLKF
ncbi:energy-coupling factor transporter transmembrane component T [Spiroplasma endosymbiont of Labia minor]|uniref:energy-coupling factor transporter transmembrane component T family protein n=1 Tax=Spiroplasma endosymbiont of Labia minor TaxID=3066305 RepID=UPI0030D169CC